MSTSGETVLNTSIQKTETAVAQAKASKKWFIVAIAVGALVVIGIGGFSAVGLLHSHGLISLPRWLASAVGTVGHTPHFWSLWAMGVGGGVVGGILFVRGVVGLCRRRSEENPKQWLQWDPLVQKIKNANNANLFMHHEGGAITLVLEEHASQNFSSLSAEDKGASCTMRCLSALDDLLSLEKFEGFLQCMDMTAVQSAWQANHIGKGHCDFLTFKAEHLQSSQGRLGLRDLLETDSSISEHGKIIGTTYYHNIQFNSYQTGIVNEILGFCKREDKLYAVLCTGQFNATFGLVVSKAHGCSIVFDPHRNTLTVIQNDKLPSLLEVLMTRERSPQISDIQAWQQTCTNDDDLLGASRGDDDISLDSVDIVICTPKNLG